MSVCLKCPRPQVKDVVRLRDEPLWLLPSLSAIHFGNGWLARPHRRRFYVRQPAKVTAAATAAYVQGHRSVGDVARSCRIRPPVSIAPVCRTGRPRF